MGAQNWGALQESTTSARLITDAINDAISAHNADPTAHGGAGEALDNHKGASVIDHPAGSIVGDKYSPDQIQYYDNFTGDVANYNPVNDVTLGAGVIVVNSFHHPAGRSSAEISPPYSNNTHFPANDITIDFMGIIGSTSSANTPFLCFGDEPTTGGPSFGLILQSGTLKGFFYDGSAFHYATLTFTGATRNTYRIYVNSNAGTIEWYINGVLAGTLTIPSFGAGDFANGLNLFADSTISTQSYIQMTNLRISYPLDL